MSDTPKTSTHAPNGRFAPGNKLGRGNPLAGRAAKIRAILLKTLTPKDAKEIAETLIVQAKGGDLAAIRELLDRTIGKPAQSELLERLERLEILMQHGAPQDSVEYITEPILPKPADGEQP